MTDGHSYVPYSRRLSEKDILEDDAVEKILSKLDIFYRDLITRHMMASERKAYNDGVEKGKTHEYAKS